MPTRNVVLTTEQAALIERLVASGRYQNASEVMRDGLRLLDLRERADAAWLEHLRKAVALGEADLSEGRYAAIETDADLDAFMASLEGD